MSQEKIEWVVGGLHIPNVGLTEVGKTLSVEKRIAESLIEQGIAKRYLSKKLSRKINKEALKISAETSSAIEKE